MQNPSRWGFVLGNTPNARILRWGYQYVGIKKPCGANANPKICVTLNENPKICVTPNANPQREQVEYRLRWVPNTRDWHWPCKLHVVCVHFIYVG